MKLIYIIIPLIFLSACANLHVQSVQPLAASLIVQNTRIVEGEKYKPFVAISIDGKRVARKHGYYDIDPQSSYVKALIDPGLHQVKIEITAYNGLRAKYEHETIELMFSSQSQYVLSVEVPEVVSETIKSDSWANIVLKDIVNGTEVLNKKIILKDSIMRSVAEGPIFIMI